MLQLCCKIFFWTQALLSLIFVVQIYVFLVANQRLYNSLCLSVRRSPSQLAEFKPKRDLTSINAPAQRSRLLAGLSALFHQKSHHERLINSFLPKIQGFAHRSQQGYIGTPGVNGFCSARSILPHIPFHRGCPDSLLLTVLYCFALR